MILFDGMVAAQEREAALAAELRVWQTSHSQPIRVAAILFSEDTGSRLYTRLKQEAATRLGIEYVVYPFSVADDPRVIVALLKQLEADKGLAGVIIQKPWKQTWIASQSISVNELVPEAYQTWWSLLVSAIAPNQDVDGLRPEIVELIRSGQLENEGRVLPATVRAVLTILSQVNAIEEWPAGPYAIVGRSDLLGKPLAAVLEQREYPVFLLGQKELKARVDSGVGLSDCSVVVSSTGRAELIRGEWLAPDCIVIDVGEPKPDIHRPSVDLKASFLTPVPGGVGPLTVVSLMENAFYLAQVQTHR